MYEYIEVEQSEDEEVSIEVDVSSSDDDFVPMASKPPQNQYEIVQGSISGKEYQGMKKDSQPMNQSEELSVRIEIKPKKKKKVK